MRSIVLPLLLVCGTTGAAESSYALLLGDVAREIALLKRDHPQLADFSPGKDLDPGKLSISYAYRTHRAARGGGWTAAVPNPDEDGIWFYIDLHDPASTLQIHTQPADPVPSCIGGKRVSFLILEGTATAKVGGQIGAILQRHGAIPCEGTRP